MLQRLQLYLKLKRYKLDQTSRLGDEICRERESLQKDIESWDKQRCLILPLSSSGIEIHYDDEDGAQPETVTLDLPSDFDDVNERRTRGLEEAAKIECQLREGQAFDLLDKLRFTLQ